MQPRLLCRIPKRQAQISPTYCRGSDTNALRDQLVHPAAPASDIYPVHCHDMSLVNTLVRDGSLGDKFDHIDSLGVKIGLEWCPQTQKLYLKLPHRSMKGRCIHCRGCRIYRRNDGILGDNDESRVTTDKYGDMACIFHGQVIEQNTKSRIEA